MNDSVSSGSPPTRTLASRTLRWTIAVIGFGGLLTIAQFIYQRTGPTPPPLKLEAMDPAVAQVLRECQQTVLHHRRDGRAWGRLGQALFAYEFRDESRRCLSRAAELDPRNPRWPYFLGLASFPDQSTAGVQQLARAAELYGDVDSSVRNRLAVIQSDLGDYEAAEREFRRVIDTWPADPTAILGLGKIALTRGDLEQGRDYLNRAAKHPSTTKAALQLLINVAQRQGDTASAEQYSQQLSHQPADRALPDPLVEEASDLRTGRRAWLDDATDLFRQGRFQEAEPILQRTVAAYADSKEAWALLGGVKMRLNALDAAQEAWQRVLALDANDVQAHLQLGVTQLRQRQVTAAIQSFRRAAELKPNLMEAHFNLGLAYATASQFAEAAASFQQAIHLRPDYVDAYLGLADMEHHLGRTDAARQALEQAKQLAPGDERLQRIQDQWGPY